jgi:L-rhamnose mutarotase
MTTRVCFELHVRPDALPEYLRRHTAVWPEFLEELDAAGWRNYTIFSRGDGFLVGYFETDDLGRAEAEMAASEVNARWQADMAAFFEAGEPVRVAGVYAEIFNLADQLAAARSATSSGSGLDETP